jgi:glycosyltransferase involved in cell wall biosynthesis
MPKFSIVIPTRNRAHYLRSCMQTLTAIGSDYEVIVYDNSDEKNVKAAKFAAMSNRFMMEPKFFHTTPTSMRNNWEWALSEAEGDYVTILGDDDGFMPNGLKYVAGVLDRHPVDIVTWRPHAYWWPDAPLQHKKNLLFIMQPNMIATPLLPIAQALEFAESQDLFAFERLPMIYNSFVSRQLIDRIRHGAGEYFCHDVPDVWSGVVNAIHAKTCLFIGTPVTMRGIGGKSYGAGLRGRAFNKVQQQIKREKTNYCHEKLIDSSCLAIHVNSVKLAALERYPDVLKTLSIDIGKVIDGMLYEMAENHAKKEVILKDIENLAKKYDHNINIQALYDAPPGIPMRERGWKDGYLAIDTEDLAEVTNIEGATKYARFILGDI